MRKKSLKRSRRGSRKVNKKSLKVAKKKINKSYSPVAGIVLGSLSYTALVSLILYLITRDERKTRENRNLLKEVENEEEIKKEIKKEIKEVKKEKVKKRSHTAPNLYDDLQSIPSSVQEVFGSISLNKNK